MDSGFKDLIILYLFMIRPTIKFKIYCDGFQPNFNLILINIFLTIIFNFNDVCSVTLCRA